MGDNDEAGGPTRHKSATSQPSPPAGTPDPDPTECGGPKDNDRIWIAATNCKPGTGSCYQRNNTSVVLDGTGHNKRNYITAPLKRINGIECSWITDPSNPDYWHDALAWAQKSPTIVTDNLHELAFGINSKAGRTHGADQLHIHMASVRDYSQKSLIDQDSKIAENFSDWHQSLVKIWGWNSEDKHRSEHAYRVVKVTPLIKYHLFYELRSMVHQSNMYLQTLIVIARPAGGWYIVNSEKSLKYSNVEGSNTCDPLLLIQPGG